MVGLYESCSEKQQESINVMIGAQIFYVGSSMEDYNKISKSAYEKYTDLLAKGEKKAKALSALTKEHQTPRKVGGGRLMGLLKRNPEVTLDEFEVLVNDLLQWNYVTKEENIRLKPFQKISIFSTPEDSYAKAGIELLDVRKF